MDKRGDIEAEKWGYWIAYAFLFTIAVLYAASFLRIGDAGEFNREIIEDSVIANRILSCFSDDKLGVINDEKVIRSELIRCFAGDKYFLKITLDKKNGEDKSFSNVDRELHNFRTVKRYVNLGDEEGILEINYVKNLRRYEEI